MFLTRKVDEERLKALEESLKDVRRVVEDLERRLEVVETRQRLDIGRRIEAYRKRVDPISMADTVEDRVLRVLCDEACDRCGCSDG